MVRFNGMLLVAGLFAACGGEDAHHDQPGTAGVAGTLNASGASGQSESGSGQNGGGSGGTHAGAGSAGRAGAASAAGMAGGGAPSGGTAGNAGVGGAAGGGAISTPEMLVPTAKAYCAAARACCAKQSDPVHLDDCESGFGARDQTSQGLRRGTVTIDAADLAKCQAAYEAAATSCEENGVLDACAGIVHGNVAEGGPCLLSQECAGSGPRVCVIAAGQDATGVCKATPGGKVGDACSLTCRPNEICSFTVYGISDSPLTPCLESDGVFCNNQLVPAVCEALRAVGAPCDRDDQCGFSAYCDGSGSKTCKKRGQLNEACGTCIASLMCKDGKCQSPPLTVGGTCDGYSLGPY
jgi:hypothetical protein